ncbi:serine/threonine-protein kinase ATG1a [Silene latifolia]|uniref:serine/threonine-protein kinase ATG1a n=1 Tax=Silene latifolia TaxID=37657 RepID=UPI003D77EAF4
MEFNEESMNCRVVGDYVIGPRIGSGSFAVVWKSKHRHLGTEFAIKEIDKKHLNDNLLKEIQILRNVNHPNIIRLFDAIETEERIFLVLEYCDGGDLGEYIHRHGRVSEDVAKHFMKQLAAGLRVLRENHLIHRDLKPQNLLLSSKEVTPMLKIGDFGFARYLTQGLADTLCGSPLYMAPEIIQNQKYDAKADLWSVGAILYQLVIGRPPFNGNSQVQLFQNILRSTELRFPEGALQVLDPDCVELCRSLLRRNPVERLTFEEFFNHKFLTETRVSDSSSLISQVSALALTGPQRSQSQQEDKLKTADKNFNRCSSTDDEQRDLRKDHYSNFGNQDMFAVLPTILSNKVEQSVEGNPCSSSHTRVADSLDTIEREYVLVHSNFASMEILTSSLGTSLKDSSNTRPLPETREKAPEVVRGVENDPKRVMGKSSTWHAPRILWEAHELSVLHPSTRLQLLHQYLGSLSDLAQEKFDGGFILESFSVELVVLALWKEAFQICSSWLSSGKENDASSLGNESCDKAGASSSSNAQNTADFRDPASMSGWAEQGFILACDRTEKLSKYLQDGDGAAKMPDAIEIIYETALAAGKYGAADQLIGNRESASMLYSKALVLLSFVVTEAPALPLNPPFSLADDVKQRILKYIKSLETHLNHSNPSQYPSFLTK